MRRLLLVIIILFAATLLLVSCTNKSLTSNTNDNTLKNSQDEARKVLSEFQIPLDSKLYNEGIINVGYKTYQDLERFTKKINAEIITVVEKINVAALKLRNKTVAEIIRNLRNYDLTGIDFVEPDYKIELPVIKEEKL
ncbi:MAG: hypothetical protein ABDH59_05660, partial [Fervidobacterium sp.]